MEHYEIEDVRNRPKQSIAPLRVSLSSREGVALLHLKNEHPSSHLMDVRCSIDSNVQFERDAIQSLTSRGLGQLNAQVERQFLLDSIGIMLEKEPEAQLEVSISYRFQDAYLQDTSTFYLSDFRDSVLIRSPTVDSLLHISENIEKLSRETQRLAEATKTLTQIADGSGLRLSHRTLAALKDEDQLLDPQEVGWEGYMIILEVSAHDAISLHRIFGAINRPGEMKKMYEELPAELRQKFEKRFKFNLGD